MHLTDLALAGGWQIECANQKTCGIQETESDIELLDGETIPGFEDWQVLKRWAYRRDLSVYHAGASVVRNDLMVKVKNALHRSYLSPQSISSFVKGF